MENFFLLNVQKSEGLSVNDGAYQLGNDLALTIDCKFPSAIINNSDYFYFRFGSLLGQNNEADDLDIANSLLSEASNPLNANNGYFGVFFFNKISGIGDLYADRIGAHKIFFQRTDNSLTISNHVDSFKFNDVNKVDEKWMTEIVNFKICTGSHTYNPAITQLPAAQYYKFDSQLNPVNTGFYWKVLDRVEHSDISLDDAAKHSLKLINKHLSDSNIKDKKVAVLLSGGVDSSLLAGLTKQHNNNVVAITPVFKSGDNPELAAAKAMAKSIDIEHQVVEISDQEIKDEFSFIVNFLKQPIRSPQTIIFSILMRQFKGKFDAVIFGEGADMIFGYHAVSQASKRYEKYCKVAPFKFFAPLIKPFNSVSIVKKLSDLMDETVTTQVLTSWMIEYAPEIAKKLPDIKSNDIEILEWLKLASYNHKNLDKTGFENLVRKFIIHESCMYHFHTMGAIADREGVELISPFFDAEVVEYAANFDNRLYFGSEFTKPILRKISESFYSKDLIYSKKQGFPTPHEKWLEGPLKTEAVAAKTFIDSNYGPLSKSDNEFTWLVMALIELDIADALNH